MTMSPTDLFTAILAGLLGASLGVGAWIAWHSLRRLRARATHLEAELAAARDSLLGLSHFKDVLDRTLDALYIFTASDLTLIYVNQGCATQLDFQIEDLLGRSLRVIKADGGEEAFHRHGDPLRRGPKRSTTYESAHRRRDGSSFPVEIFLQYIEADSVSGQPARYVAIARDISARRAGEAALRNATAQIEAILANIPVGISIISTERRIIRVNQAFCKIYGGVEAEMLGRSTEEFYSNPRDFDELSKSAIPLVRQGQTFAADYHMRRLSDSRELWCRLTGRLIDPAEPALGFVWVHDDITERRQTEQTLRDRQELFEQLFRSNSAVKMLIDPMDGRIVDVNPAAASFYGFSAEQLRNMRISDINTLAPEEVQQAIQKISQRGPQQFQFRHRLASGEVRDVEVFSGPIQVQGRNFLFSIIHDVSERVRSEAALVQRTAELQRSNADLEAFAYVASHDLRQPLRMVNSYLALLERRLGDQLDKESGEFLGFAQSGARRMDQLILDLLDYARVGRGGHPLTAVPLTAVMEDALPPLEAMAAELGASLSWPDHLPTVIGDRQELVRLIRNLVDNALKYRDPSRPPKVEIACERQGSDWLLSVSDNGIGIENEYFERIFGLFQRLHAPGTFEGTGIGLAICKKIADHHGGRIWLESKLGEGSRFFVALPVGGPKLG